MRFYLSASRNITRQNRLIFDVISPMRAPVQFSQRECNFPIYNIGVLIETKWIENFLKVIILIYACKVYFFF